MLFIAIRNSVTLSIEPCGMPFCRSFLLDMVPFVRILIVLLLRKFLQKTRIFPWIFRVARDFRMLYFQVVSYALLRSKKIAIVFYFMANDSMISVSSLIILSYVDLFFRKPLCSDVNKLFFSRYHISLLLIIFSSNLYMVFVRAIGL